MELRHLKYFIAVAEELHFARAANRLHIETSPLSRAIKELEVELGVRLFERDTRKTRITGAGTLLLEEARHLFITLEQTRTKVRALAQGFHGTLRIGYSDGLAHLRLATSIAQFRREEPDVDVRIFEMPFIEQEKNLRAGLLDVGLTLSATTDEEIIAEPLWRDPIVVVLPVNHSLTRWRKIPLKDIARAPMVLCHPQCGSGSHAQLDNLLRAVIPKPFVAEYAVSAAAGITLVASGYGIGLMGAAEVAMFQRSDIVVRPLSRRAHLTTYLWRTKTEPTGAARRFIEHLRGVI
jgi:DNA-binding transcriptional LysR family regulator